MTETPVIAVEDAQDEIAALVRTLHETQLRLQELAGGEVDAVVHPGGHSYMLHEAQEKLRRSEEALQRQQAELKTLFDVVPAMIWFKDTQNRFLRVNQRVADSTGMRIEEIEGKSAYDIFPTQAAGYYADDLEVIQSGAPKMGIVEKLHGPEGQELWVQTDKVPLCDPDGKVTGLVAMVHDVTQRQQAERALRESEVRLRFLNDLGEATRPLAEPAQIMAVTARMLGEHLRVSRCAYADVEKDGEHYTILHEYTDNCASRVGRYDIALFGVRTVATLQGGHTLIIRNVEAEYLPGDGADSFLAAGVQAVICCPLVKDGGLRAMMAVYQTESRDWQPGEIGLVEEVVERCWAMIERRTAEENLRQSEALLRIAGRTARLGGWGVDLPASHVTWSDEVCAIHEMPPGTMPEVEQALNYYTPQSREIMRRAFTDCVAEGKPFDLELEITTAKGHSVQVRAIGEAQRNATGTISSVQGAFQDITERKLAEREVRLNEQRYRSLVEATTAIVWDTPASGEFVVAQPAWSAFTGQTFEELRGWGWLNAIHPDDRKETARVWSATVANRGIYQVEHRLMSHDGTYRDMLVRAVPILAEDGTIVQWVGIHTDMTERRKLEQQVLRSQRMESIGTLAGGIAHDLNNVLGPIILSLDIMNARFPDSESQELISIVSASAQRGADMVRQVLSFGRGVEGRRMDVQINHLVREIVKIVGDTFLKNIQVRTILAPDVWTVSGDPTQLHQVLLNLCLNARDAMPEGGAISISAKNVTFDAHYAGLTPEAQPGSYVALQVEDNGRGMPPSVIEKIFDPFYTTKELGKGTGLGLSTSLGIVKSHGGFIQVYSEPERGTTFRVYIPAQTEVSPATAAAREAEMPRGHGELILVVDDESSVREITRQTLEFYGYRVVLASDGATAVAIYASRPTEIAALLTDMMMPGIDGPATIQIVRKMSPKLPIIAASGLSTDGQVAKAAGLGVKYFLPKPFTAELLLKTLKQALQEEP